MVHVRIAKVRKDIPLKEGLRPASLSVWIGEAPSPKGYSTKRRIKTGYVKELKKIVDKCPKGYSTKRRIKTIFLRNGGIIRHCPKGYSTKRRIKTLIGKVLRN